MKFIYLIVAVALVGAATFFLISFYPKEQIASQLPFSVEDGDGYVVYNPAGKNESETLIIVTAPGDGREAAIKYMKYWRIQADKHSFVLLAFTNPGSQDAVGSALRLLPDDLKNKKIIMTGLSAGGYFSCGVGLQNEDLVDAIIPMASFCDARFNQKNPTPKIPILTVIGSKDDWALGNDGQLPYEAKGDLNVAFLIVEGLGHAFPSDAMDEIGDWVENL